MAGDLINLLSGAATAGGALGYLNLIPSAAKDRLMSGCTFLVGRYKRRVDVHDKREDAEIADEEKRAGNKTTAEQKVLDTLVPDIAKHIAGDEALMGRALVSVMGEAYRKQENKEAVVEECLKDIEGKEEDVSSNPDPLDEDWLDIFSSYAEKANTERTRQLWGRILSGEVRKPGSISLATLRVLSEIDKSTAEFFTELSSLFLKDGLFITDEYKAKNFRNLINLQTAGLISGVQAGITRDLQCTTGDIIKGAFGCFFLEIHMKNGKKSIHIPAIMLTYMGIEINKIISSNINTDIDLASNFLIEIIPKYNVSSINIHMIISQNGDLCRFEKKPFQTWEENT